MKLDKKLQSISKLIDQKMIQEYAILSGDHNPIHIDQEFAKTTDFGKTIAHGMLLLSMISEMMLINFGDNWLNNGKLKIKFRNPLFVGQNVECKGKINKVESDSKRSLIECEVVCNSDDGKVLISGTTKINIEER
ncbi:MAG: hypothetical protein CL899_01970 [Dehalococcoidia bacterium]|nr:hypothetical protein [Dehalococcoidia bacterium]|tara:strand:+ start:43 stop:447 length:405 start_codon:yes stop_codon:yes gene_type:complete